MMLMAAMVAIFVEFVQETRSYVRGVEFDDDSKAVVSSVSRN